MIISIVIVGLLTLLDSSTRLAKQETQAADAQGGGRSAIYEVTRLVRQARVGHLSPLSSAMPFANNATAETITAGTEVHTLRPGTDAIEIRGTLYGDTYFFDAADVTCAGVPCTGTGKATVNIRQAISTGFQNFQPLRRPALASRAVPFYFVVSDTSFQTVTKGTAPYTIPLYYVGKVTDAGKMVDTSTFQLIVDFNDAGAKKLNATTLVAQGLQRPFSGGAVDDLILFIDRGPKDPDAQGGGYTHPFLAQASQRGDGSWDVQRLVDDVEDMQFAYGIDGLDTTTADRGIDPAVFLTGKDDGGKDEWAFNAEKEEKAIEAEADAPRRFEEFLTGPPSAPTDPAMPTSATPALRAIYVAIVTKSLDPDFKFDGPGAKGIKTFDSTAVAVSATQNYRRRVQTMAVSLRNFL